MAIKVTGNITDHFTIDEYAVSNPSSVVEITPRSLKHTRLLEELRVRYNKIMHVTSYYRTVALNKKVGGIATSNHLTGTAVDIYFNIKCTSTVAKTVMKYWKDICAANGEVGEAGWYPGWAPRGGLHLGIQNASQKKANGNKFVSWRSDPKTGKLDYGYFKNI